MESVLQYFYHRNVKSRLQRDIKYVMNEHKTDRYNYKKASDLLDDLQNIEQSLQIPSIYNIVVKIGNIMGYIRTIKSAVKNYESSIMMYTQNNRENLKIDNENDFMEETRSALKNFENIKNASPDEVTYFKVSNYFYIYDWRFVRELIFFISKSQLQIRKGLSQILSIAAEGRLHHLPVRDYASANNFPYRKMRSNRC